MDHYKFIYHHQASAYHQLISAEDCDQNLLPALKQITSLRQKKILDLGTGSGRIPLLLSEEETEIVGLDMHFPMLRESFHQQRRISRSWLLVQGDIRRLPFASQSFDITIAGWAMGHWCGWRAESWRFHIRRMLLEILRILKPGGWMIILETLGTGVNFPAPPNETLGDYYSWLESDWGFCRRTIQTDYCFDSVKSAIESTAFFFGNELAAQIQENQWARIPEWTGIWSRPHSPTLTTFEHTHFARYLDFTLNLG